MYKNIWEEYDNSKIFCQMNIEGLQGRILTWSVKGKGSYLHVNLHLTTSMASLFEHTVTYIYIHVNLHLTISMASLFAVCPTLLSAEHLNMPVSSFFSSYTVMLLILMSLEKDTVVRDISKSFRVHVHVLTGGFASDTHVKMADPAMSPYTGDVTEVIAAGSIER